jgi:hypothetical protein
MHMDARGGEREEELQEFCSDASHKILGSCTHSPATTMSVC